MTRPDLSTVLLASDDPALAAALARLLAADGMTLTTCTTMADALAAIVPDHAGIVVADRLPNPGLDLELLRRRDPDLPIVLVADTVPADDAWDTIRRALPSGTLATLRRAMTVRALTLDNRRLRGVAGADGATLPDRVAAFERGAIEAALATAGGDASAAMAALGLPRKTFYYKVQRHGIDIQRYRVRSVRT